MYTIDTKSNADYFLVINNEKGTSVKISKASNTLDAVKKLVGLVNIKEII